jgi:hypothetical protein
VQKSGDGKLKVRTSMLAMGKSGVEVVCRKCGGDVPLPLEPGAELRKAMQEPAPRLKLVLRKVLDSSKPVP